jgi:hypothetical protein
LADSIRSSKYKNEGIANHYHKENIMRKSNKSRSKSPSKFDNIPEKGSAVKNLNESGSVPAWYKALKKTIN